MLMWRNSGNKYDPPPPDTVTRVFSDARERPCLPRAPSMDGVRVRVRIVGGLCLAGEQA